MKIMIYDHETPTSYYEVELCIAEDVAENGDHANTMKFGLPSDFNINNENHWNSFKAKLKPIVDEHGFDTMIIRKEVVETRMYNILGDDK